MSFEFEIASSRPHLRMEDRPESDVEPKFVQSERCLARQQNGDTSCKVFRFARSSLLHPSCIEPMFEARHAYTAVVNSTVRTAVFQGRHQGQVIQASRPDRPLTTRPTNQHYQTDREQGEGRGAEGGR